MASEKILVVDNEIDILELCKRILESAGYQVVIANNGQKALNILKQQQFDLLLCDIKMPGITGMEIAQTIRKYDPVIICVAMTGHTTLDMVLEAMALGIDEFVMKPFPPGELTMAIAKALEKGRLRKENFRLRSLIPLFELNKTLLEVVEVKEVLRRLVEISKKETKADMHGLYTIENNKFISYSDCFDNKDKVKKESCKKLVKQVLKEGKQRTLTYQNGSDEDNNILDNLGVKSIIATPLKYKKDNLGVLILARTKSGFTPSDKEFLAVLAGQASIAIVNARLFTEVQDANKELKMLDHMKNEFINIAAHELRTPLTVLMGYATVLEEETEGITHTYITTIMRNAMRLRALLEDMLQLEYLKSGGTLLNQDNINLSEVMDVITQDVSLEANKKKLNIKINIPDDFPTMVVDHQKLELIILHLLNNAVKFTPVDGHITFKAIAHKKQAIIAISDTGIGIPKEKLSHIFDRFYQVEHSLIRQFEGIGLGLSIVKEMIEKCGGKIHVQSVKGEGTTFTFTLPLDNRVLKKNKPK